MVGMVGMVGTGRPREMGRILPPGTRRMRRIRLRLNRSRRQRRMAMRAKMIKMSVRRWRNQPQCPKEQARSGQMERTDVEAEALQEETAEAGGDESVDTTGGHLPETQEVEEEAGEAEQDNAQGTVTDDVKMEGKQGVEISDVEGKSVEVEVKPDVEMIAE
jgi:hypothetical protein